MAELTKPMDIVLRAIREERAFRQDFSAAADSIVDKIYSYYTNPNCSCKGAIVEWINKNVEVTNTILQKNDAAIVAIQGEVTKAADVAAKTAEAAKAKVATPGAPAAPPNQVAILQNPNAKFGAIFDIDRDPAAYKALIVKAMTEGWIYRGCTIIPEVVAGKAVWSVFFF